MTTQNDEGLEQVLDQLEGKGKGERASLQSAEVYSPTLIALDVSRRPNPMPVCAACPSSMWFASRDGVKAYCRVMHSLTWTSDEPDPILTCDGITLPMG